MTAPSAFYRGEIAQAIHEAMAAHGGLITRDDLAAYSVRVGLAAHRDATAASSSRSRPARLAA